MARKPLLREQQVYIGGVAEQSTRYVRLDIDTFSGTNAIFSGELQFKVRI